MYYSVMKGESTSKINNYPEGSENKEAEKDYKLFHKLHDLQFCYN